MFRRIWMGIMLISLAAVLYLPAAAVQTGTLKVRTCGGTVVLYRVGDINGMDYILRPEYGGGTVSQEDALSENLASWLDELAGPGQIKAAGMDGEVAYENLEPGLYLVAQRSAPAGCEPFSSFLLPIPWDGQIWEVSMEFQGAQMVPRTEDTKEPSIWLMAMMFSSVSLAVLLYRGKISVYHNKWVRQ